MSNNLMQKAHGAPRCTATSKRSRQPCRAPAVRDGGSAECTALAVARLVNALLRYIRKCGQGQLRDRRARSLVMFRRARRAAVSSLAAARNSVNPLARFRLQVI